MRAQNRFYILIIMVLVNMVFEARAEENNKTAGQGPVIINGETIVGKDTSRIESKEPVSEPFQKDHETIVGRDPRYKPSESSVVEESVVSIDHETVIGRSPNYVPAGAYPATIILVLNPHTIRPEDKEKIVPVCRASIKKGGVSLDERDWTITIIVERSEGEGEVVAENAKNALRKILNIDVIESRVRH